MDKGIAENKRLKRLNKENDIPFQGVKMRKQITMRQAKYASLMTESKLIDRLQNDKGYGALVSRHEILGVVTEEYNELTEAVKSKTLKEVRDELIDIAVGCIFGVACIDANALDW